MWLVQVVIVGILALINPNHYTTINSGYYLSSANYLLTYDGYVIKEGTRIIWNGVFPMGYAVLIAAVAFILNIKVLLASKIVNLLFSGIWLIYLNKWFGTKTALMTGSLLLFGGFLKIWAHTWSEPVFLIVLFFLFYRNFMLTIKFSFRNWLIVCLLGISLMLVRYAGIFIIGLSFFGILYWIKHKKPDLIKANISLTFVWTTFILTYFWINNRFGDHWFGGPRFENQIDARNITGIFSKGIINEFWLIRNTDFKNFDFLFLFGVMAQVLFLFLIYKNDTKQNKINSFRKDQLIHHSITIAFFYLLFLIIIRLLSPFDEPGYRLLSPFSFYIFWPLLYFYSNDNYQIETNKLVYYCIFVVLTWLEILPEKNLNEKIMHLLPLF